MVLRDRINDLLSANMDLQKEVSDLRMAHEAKVAAAGQEPGQENTLSADLKETRESLNEIAIENDQLIMEIAKAR